MLFLTSLGEKHQSRFTVSCLWSTAHSQPHGLSAVAERNNLLNRIVLFPYITSDLYNLLSQCYSPGGQAASSTPQGYTNHWLGGYSFPNFIVTTIYISEPAKSASVAFLPPGKVKKVLFSVSPMRLAQDMNVLFSLKNQSTPRNETRYLIPIDFQFVSVQVGHPARN